MPIAVAALVGPADFRVRKAQGLLTCVGLRSGACLCLFDPQSRVGGMVHITDADCGDLNPSRPGKYVSSGVNALIAAMERTGAHRRRLVAVIAGGAEVSVNDGADDIIVIDLGICQAVRQELDNLSIPLVGQDFGGEEDRSVILDVFGGEVTVRTRSGDRVLCPLTAQPGSFATAA